MRIAILLTSNDTSEFARRFPDDGRKFVTLLQPHAPDWLFTVLPVFEDAFPESAADFDGYVITGSPASVHDPHPWIGRLLELIRKIAVRKIPLVGVCFGHQAIALALGGKVGPNPQGWVLGVEKTSIVEPKRWMQPPSETLSLYAAHKEQVTSLPAGAVTIGSAPGCPHAAFTVGSTIMTTEYHPEMTPDFMDALVDEMGDAITPEQAIIARKQFAAGEQGSLFGKWMVSFFSMPREAG